MRPSLAALSIYILLIFNSPSFGESAKSDQTVTTNPSFDESDATLETIGSQYKRLLPQIDTSNARAVKKSTAKFAYARNRAENLIASAFYEGVQSSNHPSPPFEVREAEAKWVEKEVTIYVSAQLADIQSLKPAIDELSTATSIELDLVSLEGAHQLKKNAIYVDAFTYIENREFVRHVYLSESEIKAVPIQEPISDVSLPYCQINHLYFIRSMACLRFKEFTNRYFDYFSGPHNFWNDSALFLNRHLTGVDGFLSTHKNGEIYFAQCWVPVAQSESVRRSLVLECLVRSLGLVQTQSTHAESLLSGPHRYIECISPNEASCRNSFGSKAKTIQLSRIASITTKGGTVPDIDMALLRLKYLK